MSSHLHVIINLQARVRTGDVVILFSGPSVGRASFPSRVTVALFGPVFPYVAWENRSYPLESLPSRVLSRPRKKLYKPENPILEYQEMHAFQCLCVGLRKLGRSDLQRKKETGRNRN